MVAASTFPGCVKLTAWNLAEHSSRGRSSCLAHQLAAGILISSIRKIVRPRQEITRLWSLPNMSQLTVIQLPQAHELSGLDSPRESDSVLRQYRRANVSNFQQRSVVQAIYNLDRKIEKIRRRILGGAGAATPSGNYIGEIDLTGATQYQPQQFGRISAGSNMGTYVCITATDALSNPPQLPDTGNQYWNCISNSQAQWM